MVAVTCTLKSFMSKYVTESVIQKRISYIDNFYVRFLYMLKNPYDV